MKTHLLSLLLGIVSVLAVKTEYAQVAVNSDGLNADSSAMLDVNSATRGFLVPRLTSDQKNNISKPATGLLIYQTDGATGFYYNGGTPIIPDWVALSSSSTQALWLRSPADNSTFLANSDDSVGIGKTVPFEKLDIQGNLDIDNFQPLILFREDSLEAGRISHLGPPDIGYLHLQAWDGNNFETTGIVVKSPAQHVGVGTTTPYYRLDVAGTTRTSGFILSTATESGYILTSDENGAGTWQLPASHLAGSGTPGYLARFSDSDTLNNSVVCQNNGNIGIGNNNPQAKLDVNGKVWMHDNIRLDDNWLSGDGNNEGVFVDASGKVGVGTSSPESLFTSAGMIQTTAGGVKFPDNTVQTTAAASATESVSPIYGAEPRWIIGMWIEGIPGPENYYNCNDCSRVFDLDWYLHNTYDSITGQVTNQYPQHHVVSILKDIDKASVGLFEKLANPQEEIQKISLHFYTPPDLHDYYVIELFNVKVIELHHSVKYVGEDRFAHFDKVVFLYGEIRLESRGPGGTDYQDSWVGR